MATSPFMFTRPPLNFSPKSRARIVLGMTLGYITFGESKTPASDNYSVRPAEVGSFSTSLSPKKATAGNMAGIYTCQFHGGDGIMSDQFTSEYFSRQAQEA